MPDWKDTDTTATRVDTVDGLACPKIHNGYYTLVFPCGTHKTFRLYTQRKGKLAGNRIVALLIGPDNSSDYEGFGFLTERGVAVWKSKRGGKIEEYASLLWKHWNGEVVEGYELMASTRCLVCNNKLTDPVSIETGIGPTCRLRSGT